MSNNFTENLTSGDKARVEQALLAMASLNVQIYPSKTRVILNDKDTKVAFGLTDEIADELFATGVGFEILEKKHKKHGDIVTKVKITNVKGYFNKEPLDQFDFAVFSVCISEQFAGNFYITPAIILRGLTGKIGKGDAEPNSNQRAAIMHSLQKLMGTVVRVDLTDYCEKLKIKVDKPPVFVGQVLPAQYVEATVNGKDATVIYFPKEQDKSPLLRAAGLKNQIIRYDAALLNVPNQNNTPRIIAVKNYVMRRIVEIKAHKMTPTITFNDVFKKCNLNDVSRKSKLDARNAIIELFEQLQAKGFVDSFKVNKTGNKFQSISFTYTPKSKANPTEKETTSDAKTAAVKSTVATSAPEQTPEQAKSTAPAANFQTPNSITTKNNFLTSKQQKPCTAD